MTAQEILADKNRTIRHYINRSVFCLLCVRSVWICLMEFAVMCRSVAVIWGGITMRISAIVGSLMWLVMGVAVHAATLDYPDFGLSSSPQEVRTWVRDHEFAPTKPAEPGQETYQREFANGQRETVSFVPGGQGLDMLRFEQIGVLEGASALRSKVYEQFGKPQKDQILKGGTLRLTYAYEHSEPARRIFLLQPHYVSLLLITEAYINRNNKAQARAERVEQETQQAAEREARNAWLIPLIWVGGILLGLFVLNKIVPRSPGNPVTRALRSVLNGLFGLTHDVLIFVLYQASGFLMYGMFLLSGLAAGAGALEWGTSWWWVLPILFGFVVMVKAHDDNEDFLPQAYVATAFFAVGLFGPIFQHSWPYFTSMWDEWWG